MAISRLANPRVLNALLRLVPMVAKLALTVYVGRYLALDAMGIYGLVFGAVMLLGELLGQGLGYIVVRDIVDAPPPLIVHRLRDQALLYACNCLLLAAAVAWLIVGGRSHLAPGILWSIVALTALEGYGTATYFCMNSLNQQVWANALFCVRSGLWVLPVVLLGLASRSWRSIDVVLGGWMCGGVLSLAGTLAIWRHLPWRLAASLPVDWHWLGNGLKKSVLVWLGAVGLAGGTYVDRFVVEHFLALGEVGVITFYASFTNSLLALMHSGILAFATPRLIQFHREKRRHEFNAEARRALRQVTAGAAGAALLLGGVVPLLGLITGRAALANDRMVLWLMLIGTWLRAVAEVYYNVLYARNQDRAVWLGNLLFLVPVVGGNALLIPLIGLNAVGVSAIASGVFLLAWRWLCVRRRRAAAVA